MKYIDEDLVNIKREYRENYTMLIATVGTPEHAKYSVIEKELYEKEVEIQKSLGIYIVKSCPIASSIYCSQCIGYYRPTKTTKKGSPKRNKRCKPSVVGAVYCSLKDVGFPMGIG